MSETGWSLHPQLCDDTALVGDLALSRVLAINDADYPWLILCRSGRASARSSISVTPPRPN